MKGRFPRPQPNRPKIFFDSEGLGGPKPFFDSKGLGGPKTFFFDSKGVGGPKPFFDSKGLGGPKPSFLTLRVWTAQTLFLSLAFVNMSCGY